MFIFEGLGQSQEDRVEVRRGQGDLIVSVFSDEPENAEVELYFTNAVFFSRSIFPGPNGVRCDESLYRLQLGHVISIENSNLAAEYTDYYIREVVPGENFKHFTIIFDSIGEIFHIIAQAVGRRSQLS